MFCVTQRVMKTSLLRPASGWLGSLLRGNTVEKEDGQANDDEPVTIQPEELLHQIAQKHLRGIADTSWKTATFGDVNTKGKILCSFEHTFNQSIPSQDLGTINTFADLLAILNSSQYQKLPQEEAAPTMYPNIKDDGTLPPNLSIQFISTAPREKPYRKPFQNYDARRPEHANFLSKQEKERRKRKRRHLTAWK